jgi:hypothetical protein
VSPEHLKKFSIAVRDYDSGDGTVTWPDLLRVVDELIAEAVAAEREACAELPPNDLHISAAAAPHAVWQAYRDAIRARAQKRECSDGRAR